MASTTNTRGAKTNKFSDAGTENAKRLGSERFAAEALVLDELVFWQAKNRGLGLPAIFGADADALDPKIGPLELGRRSGRALQIAVEELRTVDVRIDLVASECRTAPVDERVAADQPPVLIHAVHQVGVDFRNEHEVVLLDAADVG